MNCEETNVVLSTFSFFARKLKLERKSLEHLLEAEFQLASVYHLFDSDPKNIQNNFNFNISLPPV